METIKTPSRLHLSLIDMEGGLGRVDGGIGLALEEPCFEIAFERSDGVRGLEGEDRELAERACSQLGVEGVEIEIMERIPEHAGFGSKTQLSLAVAAGVCKVWGLRKTIREMAVMVGRGGTSGIGVAAFERGGFILDGGHPSEKGFSPSRFSDSPPPPVLARYDFPWWTVCAWPEGKGAHGELERGLFEEHCPMPASEVGKASRIILMRVLPALAENDLKGFGEGVSMLQEVGFKKVELDLKREEVGELLDFLQENSAGGGMSSFGPVCFGFCESASEARSLEEKVRASFKADTVVSKANNGGARWL